MGSVRNPVGPLPSSIYWRRRAVVLLLLALLTVLAVWAVNFRDGGGNSAHGPGGRSPVPSITPGPSASGPLISTRPGGSVGGGGDDGDEAADGGSGDSGSPEGSSKGADSGAAGGDSEGATEGATEGGAQAGAAGAGSSGAAGTGGSVGGDGGAPLPAGSSLPDCGPGVSLSVRSTANAYEPGERPRFTLTATNPSTTACKLDVGPDSAVFTITDVDDRHVWASDDCPKSRAPYLLQVPAGGSTSYDVEWDRRTSSPKCAAPKGRSAPYGTYLLEVKLPGRSAKQTSFVLKNV
ncbi:hypothetical protein [Actinacidiphila sp. bgisy167]|uniref:hypothetical protein n=1 Tax=Actinacidiphila sp. bgisy167 TaxID=3413797 RepID=UPI003D765B33